MADELVSPERFAGGLTDRQLHCRELGHNWRPMTASFDAKARVFDRRLRCSTCRTERVQMLSNRGEVLANRYIYPKGYLAQSLSEHPGIGAMRATFRLEAVHRFLDNVTQQNGAA
jgi:hypothetical protein